MNIKCDIDNNEPKRINKPFNNLLRKNKIKKIQNQNYKIRQSLCNVQSVVPNINQLKNRWKQQEILKKLNKYIT